MSTTPYIPNFSSSGLGYSPSYQAPITSLTPIILTPLELVSGDSFFRDTVLVSPCGTWAQQVFLTVVQDLGTTYPSATGTISVDSSFTSIIPPILTITPPTPLENEDPFVDYSISQHQYELASSLDGLSWNTFLSTNYFKYGDELGSIPLIGANYLESNLRTGLQYKF